MATAQSALPTWWHVPRCRQRGSEIRRLVHPLNTLRSGGYSSSGHASQTDAGGRLMPPKLTSSGAILLMRYAEFLDPRLKGRSLHAEPGGRAARAGYNARRFSQGK
jgi:hypothetical protein